MGCKGSRAREPWTGWTCWAGPLISHLQTAIDRSWFLGLPPMPRYPTRPTLRDIAQRAGCHYSTVSLALRAHPRIPVTTRVRIKEIAHELGYKPDAMLAALCAYRRQKPTFDRRGVIAWLTNHRTESGWRNSACNRDYFEGASTRAAERGYGLECFWLAAPRMTGARMSQILWTRNIQGLLLPPQEELCSIDIAWHRFSAVTFGYTLIEPKLHLVSNHEYRTMGKLFSELQQRSYQRLGLVNRRDHDERVDHNWLAAYLVEQNQLHRKNRLPPLILDRWDDRAFLAWYSAHRPDAIVTRLPEVLVSLRMAGQRVPADVGVAFHSLDEGRKGLSGMKKNSFQIGVMAIDLLIDMLYRNERGIPAIPYHLMVEGSWCEGTTLLPGPNLQRSQLRLQLGAQSTV
jgi:LacI family transcriptional regulator